MKKIVLDILIFRKFICDAKILFFYTKNLNFWIWKNFDLITQSSVHSDGLYLW